MADPTLEELLRAYGHGYEPAGPQGDPNSLGYAMQGPAAPVTTADDLRVMGHQQDEKAQEGPRAAANIAATLLGGVGAAGGRRATYTPSPQAESMLDQVLRYFRAAQLHQRGEAKSGNPAGYLEGLGTFGGATTATMAAALTGHPDLAALATSVALLTRPTRGSVFMGEHIRDTGEIAAKLREMQLREAAKQSSPAPKEWNPEFVGPHRATDPWSRNPGAEAAPRSAMEEMLARAEETSARRNTLNADKRASPAGVSLVEQAQKPTAGTTPLSPSSQRLERAQQTMNHVQQLQQAVAAGGVFGELAALQLKRMQRYGDIDAAKRTIEEHHAGPRSETYWRGLNAFDKAEAPSRLNATTAGAGLPQEQDDRDWLAKQYPQP